MSGAVGAWLLHGCDPRGSSAPPPRRPLRPGQGFALARQAEAHGVLPAVVRHFAPFAEDPAFAAAADDARLRLRTARSFVLMLRGELDALAGDLAGLPVAAVKGPVFARRLYPEPGLRTFTDIDLLAAASALPVIGERLRARGYRLDDAGTAAERREWKWLHRDNPLLMIEVQTDLVHAGSLRRAAALGFADLADETETVPGCLLVAAAHGAFAHGFDRLQQLVDIVEGARLLAPGEEGRFETLVARTGMRRAAVAGLSLAGRLFAEPRALAIADALGPVPGGSLVGRLVDRDVVLSAKTRFRPLHAWRRQLFREWLKRGVE